MNILVISQYYYPEQFRVTDICENLVRLGHQVTVVAGIPNYPEGEIFEGYETSYKKPEIHNGVTIIRCNNKPRHKGAKKLAINYISYVLCANKIVGKLEDKFDLIYVYQMSPITMAIPAIKYKKKHKIPMYFYCLDIWPESFRDMNDLKIMSKMNPIFLLVKSLSKWIYRKADYIGVKCDEFTDYLVKTCSVKRERCKLLYEHAESNYLSVSDQVIDNNCIDFMFLGNLGHSSNCLNILKATEKLNATMSYKIHFVGDGSEMENLKTYVTEHSMNDRVVFHGRVPQDEVIEFYNYADVCLLTLSNRSEIGLTPPAKLMGYMAASRPILGAINGASQRIIRDAGCGFTTDYDDVDGLSEYMQRIVDDPKILNSLGENGRNYFLNHFTLEKHMLNLEKQLKELIGENEK